MLGPGKPSYEVWLALYLNLGRVQTRQLWALKSAIEWALSLEPIPEELLLDVEPTEEEARKTAYEVNAARYYQQALARKGWA